MGNNIRIEYWCYVNASGYSNAAKNYITVLDELGYDVLIKPVAHMFLDQRSELDMRIHSIMQKTNDVKEKPHLKIIHAVPPVGVEAVEVNDGIPTLWLYAWEGKKLPIEMMRLFKKVTHAATFSREQVKVYKQEMDKNNITYIPHAVLNQRSYVKESKQSLPKRDMFNFLCVFEWNARKDPVTLIKSYIHEFSADEPVSLVLKAMSATPEFLKDEISKVVKGMRIKKVPPKMIPVAGYLSDLDLRKMYRESGCYVGPSRGEGFGIPFLEALFIGVPVIYPGKYMDDLAFNDQNSAVVESTDTFMYGSRFDINRGDNIWGQVSDIDLAKKMRYMYEHRDKFPNPVHPSDEFIEAYNNIPKTMDDMIKGILK